MTNKGSGFERSICKQLSLWLSDGKSNAILWRSTTSGARATVRAKKGLETPNSYGDVTAIDPIGAPLIDLVSIELKRGYSGQLTIQDLLDSSQKDPLLLKFWRQAERDRLIGKRRWSWLIFQRDRRQACIIFNSSFWDFLLNYAGKLKYSKKFRLLLKINCVYEKIHYNLYVMRLSEFLHWIDPEIFKAYAEEVKNQK
jgi:hypothetical protein